MQEVIRKGRTREAVLLAEKAAALLENGTVDRVPVSYTHLRAHET